MGIDRRDGTGWAYRTDTIMVVGLDGDSQGAAVLSIPRDLQLGIPGYGEDRIVMDPSVVRGLAYYTGVHMLILAEPRFHVPLLPIVAILAAHAFADRPAGQSRPWQRWLAALLVLLLLLNWGLEIARDWDTLVALFGPLGHQLRLSY